MKLLGFAAVGVAMFAVMTLEGCGKDCGRGTKKNNGECVVTELTCAEGTTLIEGQCVAGITGCGPYTRYDIATGSCVPSSEVCGNNTQLDEATGTCVPASEVTCGTGTIREGNTCVVEPSALCPAGEVDVGAGCVPGGYVQIIHNSPDPAAAEVGIYLNGTRYVNVAGPISNNRVAFRAATRFLPFAAGSVRVAVTAPGATDDSSPLVDATANVTAGSRVALVVSGVADPSTFTGTVQPLSIESMTAIAASDVSDAAGTFRLAFFQGAPDATTVTMTNARSGATVDVAYGDGSAYQTLTAGVHPFDATGPSSEHYGAFQTSASGTSQAAPAGFAAGRAGIALASGFVTTQASAPANTFRVGVALPEGGALRILDVAARVQAVHAAADAGNVALYVNHVQLFTSWPFRSATPFRTVPAGVPFTVGVAAAGDGEADAVITYEGTLAPGDVFAFVATSATAGAGASAAERHVLVPAMTSSSSSTTFSAAVVHAIADAGAVILRDADGNPVGSPTPITFAHATGYSDVTAGMVAFDFFSAAGPETRLTSVQSSSGATLPAPAGIAAGRATLIVASGLTADFGLYAVTAEGQFAELDRAVRVQFINAVSAREAPSVDLLVNGTPLQTAFAFRGATAYRSYPLLNDVLPVAVQPAGDATLRVSRDIDFTSVPGDLIYVVTLLGARANAVNNDLYIFPTPGRESATSASQVAVNNFNGMADLSPFDINSAADGALLFDDCGYATYGRVGSIALAATTYLVQLSDPDSSPPFIQYQAFDLDLTSRAGQAMVLLETGFQSPGSGEPAFAAIAVWPDGTVETLPTR